MSYNVELARIVVDLKSKADEVRIKAAHDMRELVPIFNRLQQHLEKYLWKASRNSQMKLISEYLS